MNQERKPIEVRLHCEPSEIAKVLNEFTTKWRATDNIVKVVGHSRIELQATFTGLMEMVNTSPTLCIDIIDDKSKDRVIVTTDGLFVVSKSGETALIQRLRQEVQSVFHRRVIEFRQTS